MREEKAITIAFPSIVMIAITLIIFLNDFNIYGKNMQGFFEIALMMIFPSMFLLQGVLCAFEKTNVIVSLGLSTVVFCIIILFLHLNIISYIFINLASGVVGYFIVNFIMEAEWSKKRAK